MGVTYLPITISSDAGYADLPLPLLGAPVSIGARSSESVIFSFNSFEVLKFFVKFLFHSRLREYIQSLEIA
jgi:hypothetical protein